MVKAKNEKIEESKNSGTNPKHKLGCLLSSDAAALLGGLEFLLGGSVGNVVERGLVALADTLSKSQQETLATMLRSKQTNLGKIRKTCGCSSVKNDGSDPNSVEAGSGGAGGGEDHLSSRMNHISMVAKRLNLEIDEALNTFSRDN